jgi:arylsulfatase A-like enzyme
MKVIYVMSDSLRRDHVGVYGAPPWGPIHTPNLERFARTAAVFDNAYIGSFPTVPSRRDTQLGHGDKGLPFNRWKALDPDEETFLQRLTAAGVPSMLITDTANNVTGGVNLQRDFTAWVCNRGQEGDPCWLDATVPLDPLVPPELIRYTADWWGQVLVNRAHRQEETDWFAPGTYTMALDWLEHNHQRESFFLWVDTFDPHEPWDPPQHYLDLYDPGYEGRVFEAPTYGVRQRMGITDRELQHIRARYAGEVTMVDHWFGKLLDKLEELGIRDETAVIHTADHGTCFDGPGDLGLLQKAWQVGADGMLMAAGRPPTPPLQHNPLSPNIVRIPLMIHLPGMAASRRVAGIVQPWDVHATLLDLFGQTCGERVIGRSLLPLARGEGAGHREAAVAGAAMSEPGGMAQVMTAEWLYAVWRGERPCCLFDLQADPSCTQDLAALRPDVVADLHGVLAEFLRGQALPAEYVAGYVR